MFPYDAPKKILRLRFLTVHAFISKFSEFESRLQTTVLPDKSLHSAYFFLLQLCKYDCVVNAPSMPDVTFVSKQISMTAM